jgi:hypothetical protein
MNYKVASGPLKKTVVVDLEYMRPSVSTRSRSRSRSQSRSQSRSRSRSNPRSVSRSRSKTSGQYGTYEDLNIDEILNSQYTTSETTTETGTVSDDSDSDSCVEDDNDSGNRNVHPSVKDTDYAVNSDDDLLQSVLDEPTFPLDVGSILDAMDKTENRTIANLTLKKIAERRREILSSLNLPPEKMEDFDRRLQMFRVIEDPYDLKHGQLLRWIPLRSIESKPYITIGGTLFNVKVRPEDGLHQITIRNVKRFVFQIKFELNVVFQRLSREELLILRAVEYVEDV